MKYNKAQFIWGPDAADKITFDLDDINPTTKYVVKGISGLEPPENVLSLGDRLFEGSVYQGRRPQSREIVMLMSFQPNYGDGEDAGTLRKKLYTMMSPRQGSVIRFRLLDDLEIGWVETTGYIKRIEANPFSKDPEVQITMSCLSAYFSEPEYVHPAPATLSGKLTIPIDNPGDVTVGFYMSQFLTANMSSYTLTGHNPSEFIKITYAFLANDRLVIETYPGFRRLVRVRSSVPNLNLLPMMSVDSTWLNLEPGLNNLKSSTTAFNMDIFRYTVKHWGF